ncbi:MAG: MarR family transcriptional regulator [Myxococcales bacterium]|nr:MarR family transcriptional regulator [Myxococcales bacterium]HQY62924.1 MarR family transcriptional regulator [Polyangiaceae bacterium]
MSTDKGSEIRAGALDPGGSEAVAAFRLLFTVSARLRARMDRLLAPITTQQAAVLTVIGAGAPSVSEVAAALSTTHQNVKQVALALERKGFVRIEGDPRDKRVRRLVATKKSARHWARRDPGDHEQTATWFEALAPGELALLIATLRKVDASLRREPPTGLPEGDARARAPR